MIAPAMLPTTAQPAVAGALAIESLLGRTVRVLLGAADEHAPAGERASLLAQAVRDSVAGAECVVAQAFRPPDWEVEVLGGAGVRAVGLVGRRLTVAEGPLARALDEGTAVELTGANRVKGLFGPLDRIAGACRIQPVLGAGRNVIGLLIVTRPSTPAFLAAERELIVEMSRLVPLVLRQLWTGDSPEDSVPVDVRSGLQIAADLAASLAAAEIVSRLLERALEAGRADYVTLWRIRGDQASVEESRDRSGTQRAGHREQRELASLPLLARAVSTRRPALAEGDDKQAVIPLLLAGEVTACLALRRRRELPFTPAELGTLQLIGNIAALALHNADLYADAQAANRVQSRLLNTAAHELRTPLTAVTAALSLLTEGSYGEPSSSWRRPVEVAAAKAAELGELVEDLLLAALLEGRQLQPTPVQLDLRTVVQESLARAEPRTRLLQAEIAVRQPDVEVPLYADPLHAGRIVDVLVANALSYGGSRPRVRLTLAARGGARLVVEDRGRGIPAHVQDRVFDAFFRYDELHSEQDRRGPSSGAGLGLYLGRELAREQGGTLRLTTSRPGRGSTFVLTLPAQP